MTEDGFI